MKKVIEMTDEEQQRVIDELETLGYSDVHSQGDKISFSDGIRVYMMTSTDIEEDLEVDFDFDSFMESNYNFKSNFTKNVEKSGSIDEACRDLNWKVINAESSYNGNRLMEGYVSQIFDVEVKGKPHLIVERSGLEGCKMYEGDSGKLKDMLSFEPYDLTSRSLRELLEEISNT